MLQNNFLHRTNIQCGSLAILTIPCQFCLRGQLLNELFQKVQGNFVSMSRVIMGKIIMVLLK